MFARRNQLSAAIRRPVMGRVLVLLPLLMTILAACNPGNGGGGPAY